MRRYSFHLILSLLFALTFTSCDSDEDGDGNGGGTVGEGQVTVTGDIDRSFSGSAVFGAYPEGGFEIALFEGSSAENPTGQFLTLGSDGGVPDEGTYDINDLGTGDTVFGVYQTDTSSSSGFISVFAESGTLTITSSSSDRLVGSFSFEGSLFSENGTQGTARVEGTFNAIFVDVNDLP
jgi:hypothetical protein